MRDSLAPSKLFNPSAFVADLLTELTRRGQPMYPSKPFREALARAVELDTSRFITNRLRELDAAVLCACSSASEIAPWEPTGDIHRNPPRMDHFWVDPHSLTPDLHPKSVQRHRREARKAAGTAGARRSVATKTL